jgi:hypothetical protein
MDWFVKAFIRASLAWFALGILLGIAIAAYPPWLVYRFNLADARTRMRAMARPLPMQDES